MSEEVYAKLLTANDTGETGGHQAGIHIPKSQADLIRLLPFLDREVKNPDAWLVCIDESGNEWSFRYVHYNNKFHDSNGTRDEYRITHMTKFFRSVNASEGDMFSLKGRSGTSKYFISIKPQCSEINSAKTAVRIRLKGWRRIH